MADTPTRREEDILQEIDPNSLTFKAIMELAAGRLETATATLRTVGLPYPETEAQRGKIVELEYLLGLEAQHEKLPQKPVQALKG